ncbi:MAG: SDR family oxidoreductase [Bryobacterales bacterium]|nr:SDR family oxidoreductase [Bryobacterales bacterium]
MILIAGATGSIGSQFVQLARSDGHRIRAFSRSAERLRGLADEIVTGDATHAGTMDGICNGVEIVVSTLGASVSPDHPGKRPFRDVDTAANLRLLDAAKSAGVRRFVYVSVHIEPGYANTAYIRAHEEVVRAVAQSGLSHTVVRPTGVFSAMASFLDLARKGAIPRIGDGRARTNPVHEADVAEVIRTHLNEGPEEVNVGGPEILERREIAAMAFAALGRKPRLLPVSPVLMRTMGKMMGLWNPRMGELTEFAAAVSVTDSIAPMGGRRKLGEYFREAAARR